MVLAISPSRRASRPVFRRALPTRKSSMVFVAHHRAYYTAIRTGEYILAICVRRESPNLSVAVLGVITLFAARQKLRFH